MAFTDLVRDGNLKKVRAAIDKGARLDKPDYRGLTPLMIACSEGHFAVAELLIERGARLDVVGRQGETALTLAMVRCPGAAHTLVSRGVLGRPLRAPTEGTLLSPSDCDVCTRYPDVINPDDRWSGRPASLAWLEVVHEDLSSEGKTDFVRRSLRCPFCGTLYEQLYSCEIETAGVTFPQVSESIRRCAPEAPAPTAQPAPPALPALPEGEPRGLAPGLAPGFPEALLGALFVAEDGKLACRVIRGREGASSQEGRPLRPRDRAPLLTAVWAGVAGRAVLDDVHTEWHPAKALRSEHASERLGRLQAELGIVGAGNLYTLYVVRANPDRESFGDKDWIAALPDTPLAELRLFPEYGGSPYMPDADDWDWQEGWWYPYSTFRPATPAEQAAHAAVGPRA